MEYTLKKLVSILKDRLQDEDYSEESLKTFLNQAQNEILGEDKYPFMQRIDEYTDIQAGEVSLPLGYGGTIALYAKRKDGERFTLRYIAPDDYFNRTGALHDVWTSFANTLFFQIDAKDTEREHYKITHLYIANPRPMLEDDDCTAIPPQYVEALLLLALARAEQRRDNFDYAQIYENKADMLLTNMKLRYGGGNLSADNTSTLPFHMGGF